MSLEGIVARGRYVWQEQRETLQALRRVPEDSWEHEELKQKLRLIERGLEEMRYGYQLYQQEPEVWPVIPYHGG